MMQFKNLHYCSCARIKNGYGSCLCRSLTLHSWEFVTPLFEWISGKVGLISCWQNQTCLGSLVIETQESRAESKIYSEMLGAEQFLLQASHPPHQATRTFARIKSIPPSSLLLLLKELSSTNLLSIFQKI
jgi:hypothetical protein